MATPTLAIHLLKGQTPPKREGGEKQSLGWHLAWWPEQVRAQLPWGQLWVGVVEAGTRLGLTALGLGGKRKGKRKNSLRQWMGPVLGLRAPTQP